MKISELNTKSFLGGTSVAANSYVLINYEDATTTEPVTYKATIQELGKAIANDLKLPSVTASQGVITNIQVKGVSSGAYTNTSVKTQVKDIQTSSNDQYKIVGYDPLNSLSGYFTSNGGFEQVEFGGGITPSDISTLHAPELGDPDISAVMALVDENNPGDLYYCSGSTTHKLFSTGGYPVIVNSSTAVGYYDLSDGTFVAVGNVGGDPSAAIELSGIDDGPDISAHLMFVDGNSAFYTVDDCGTAVVYGPLGNYWIVYDSNNTTVGYLENPTSSGVTSILEKPMAITPSENAPIGFTNVNAYFCVTDAQGDALYNCAENDGYYREILRTGGNPVVVYDSATGDFGYFVPGDSTPTPLSIGGGGGGITYNSDTPTSSQDTHLKNGATTLTMGDIYKIEKYQPTSEFKNVAFVGEYNHNFYRYESSTSSWTTLNVAFIDTVNGQTVIKDGNDNIVGTLGTYTPAT